MVDLKKLAAAALAAGALALGVVSGAGTANADPWKPWPPWPPVPGPGPGVLAPPGHLQQIPWVPPPGHWPVNPGWVNHW